MGRVEGLPYGGKGYKWKSLVDVSFVLYFEPHAFEQGFEASSISNAGRNRIQ